ncbi:hypothetical protein HY971_02020 [Candidatus Kaiserbacteria bacterium]|nr:hypothetical protein [Candidatus Kaiserbacteria bacterium]
MKLKTVVIVVLGIIVGMGLTPVARAALTVNANLLAKSTFDITGSISKGAGSFVIDHPLDPKNKLLYHSFVESPDTMNQYDGIATFDANGEATVRLPDYFGAVNTKFTYQFFPINAPMPGLYIKQKIKNNSFVIAGGKAGGQVSWMVTGVRHDPYVLAYPIIPEVEKGPRALLNKGECIFEPLCR